MGKRQKVVCFVDDDPSEVEAFNRVFGEDFTLAVGTTSTAVLDELSKKGLKPNLFVLDLYFSEGPASSDSERDRMVQLKNEVDKAQKRLSDYLVAIRQSRNGGIAIMERIRRDYPTTPIVFYTRKGTLDDAVVCMDKGADGVLPKAAPTHFNPGSDRLTQIQQAAQEHHDTLAERFSRMASSPSLFKKVVRLGTLIHKLWMKA
ncbi:MAG: hypothetical protein P8Z79_21065 [Sedimentisphaerales bacterium]|jgi:CheY-like chemotaxis protein